MTYSIYDFEIVEQHENYVDKVEMDDIFIELDSMEEVEEMCNFLVDGIYLIMKMDGNKPVKVEGVCFKEEGETFIDCAEWDFRVIATVGFGVNLM